MDNTPTQDKRCASCNKDEDRLSNPLKVCAKCKTVMYCSRECQKADWKAHKQACATAIPAPSSTTSSQTGTTTANPRFEIDRPFTALRDGTWLSTRPEKDVYQLLSDVFRLRREDQYKYDGEVAEGSVYAGGSATEELQNYRRFLRKITRLDEKRGPTKKLLPSWWSVEKLEECVRVATVDENAMVEYAVEKHDIQDFYKQNDMPMQLRMLGEALDGTKIMGQSGATMLEMRAGLENGSGGSLVTSLLSVSM